jgi:hypothetical protein
MSTALLAAQRFIYFRRRAASHLERPPLRGQPSGKVWQCRQSAFRIIKGAKAGDLPIQIPTKFEFVINLRAAKALRLELSPAVLARADEVLE